MKKLILTPAIFIALTASAQTKQPVLSKEWYKTLDTIELVKLNCKSFKTEYGTFYPDSGFIFMKLTYNKKNGKWFTLNSIGMYDFEGIMEYFYHGKSINPIEIK